MGGLGDPVNNPRLDFIGAPRFSFKLRWRKTALAVLNAIVDTITRQFL